MSSVITMANADSGAFSGGGGSGGGMNYVAGEAIDITKKSNTGTISVKFDGSSIILNENGELMANIPEPEPTELYNAGEGVDITDRVISVKHDETITINEQGQLHVVNSGGGSDSIFAIVEDSEGVEYEWTPEPNPVKVGNAYMAEFANLPLDYIRNDGQPFCHATNTDYLNLEWDFSREGDSFISPHIILQGQLPNKTWRLYKYENTADKLGILFDSEIEALTYIDSMHKGSKFTPSFVRRIIEPIEQLPIKATKIIAPGIPTHEKGIDTFNVEYHNTKVIKTTVNDKSVNYLYFVNIPELHSTDQPLFNFMLPLTMVDNEQNPFNATQSSLLSNGKFNVPVFIHNEDSTSFTLSFTEMSEGPGIAIDSVYESPMNMMLRGEIFVEWLPEPTRLTFNETVKCKTIEAEMLFNCSKVLYLSFIFLKNLVKKQ